MRHEVTKTLVTNGFVLLDPCRSNADASTAIIAICGLGCNTTRTGRFAIPDEATLDHPMIFAALRHVKWCRAAQMRKQKNPERVNSRQQLVRQNRQRRAAIWKIACDVLRKHPRRAFKDQVKEFQQRCRKEQVIGVTANTLKRIKYKIKAVSP